jgi:hypothetical protein
VTLAILKIPRLNLSKMLTEIKLCACVCVCREKCVHVCERPRVCLPCNRREKNSVSFVPFFTRGNSGTGLPDA